MRLLVDGYGLSTPNRVRFGDILALRIGATLTGIRKEAAGWHPVHRTLVTERDRHRPQ